MAKREIFEYRSLIEAPSSQVLKWHWNTGVMHRLIPPWENVEVLQPAAGPKTGEIAKLRLSMGPIKLDWIAEHCDYIEGKQFADKQISGPFAYWHHTHQVEPEGTNKCTLLDRVEYSLPAAPLSTTFMNEFVRNKLKRMFKYRHGVTAADLKLYNDLGGRSMKVLVTGSHGLVGTELVSLLISQGHHVTRLARKKNSTEDIFWDPDLLKIEKDQLEGFDAVVHLAGDSVASGRWTDEKKASIRQSRIKGTRLLSETLSSLTNPPKVLITASAIGYYGDRGDEILTEESKSGTGFLAEVCREWEAATEVAEKRGIRVAHVRIGVVLSPKGGALAKMLPPFLFGAGGRLGSGKQWMSWVAVDDLAGMIEHILIHDELKGAVNGVTPSPVTNDQFTKDLGSALHRPTIFPVPGLALNLLLGEMANELLLASARVQPKKLIASGYTFRHPDLAAYLKEILS
jgi:uncharacterized protein (TIGR01777 family)